MLIALRDGREVARCVRPQQAQEIHDAIALASAQAGVEDGAPAESKSPCGSACRVM